MLSIWIFATAVVDNILDWFPDLPLWSSTRIFHIQIRQHILEILEMIM